MTEFFTDIATYGFLQRALLTSIVVGTVCGVLGCFIVLRGLALMGDAISHAVLPGVAVSFMLGVSYFYGAVVFGVMTALGIGFISQNSRVKSDAAIGIVFSAFLALGIILVTEARSAADLMQILFGDILSVRRSEMWTTVAVAAACLIVIAVFYKELLVSSFDSVMATVYGLPVKAIHYGLMVMLTLVTVTSLQAVGVILVVALLITPASTAYLLSNRLSVMIVMSATFGAVSAVTGMYVSFVYNITSGAAIVLAASILFALALLFSPSQGWLVRAARKLASRRDVSISDPA